MVKLIKFFGQRAKVCCDENCSKAWGMNSRPRIYPEIGERIFGLNGESIYPDDVDNIDEDNYAYCSDGELPDAPHDPGTYEGGYGKPIDDSEKMNKWCVRECERCNMSNPGEFNKPLNVRDFSVRRYNISDDAH